MHDLWYESGLKILRALLDLSSEEIFFFLFIYNKKIDEFFEKCPLLSSDEAKKNMVNGVTLNHSF